MLQRAIKKPDCFIFRNIVRGIVAEIGSEAFVAMKTKNWTNLKKSWVFTITYDCILNPFQFFHSSFRCDFKFLYNSITIIICGASCSSSRGRITGSVTLSKSNATMQIVSHRNNLEVYSAKHLQSGRKFNSTI